MQLFFGICMLALAAHGFAGLSRANRWRTGIVLACVLVLAMGAYMPIYKLLYKYVPFYGAFRGTSKFIYLFGLFMAMLAGNGINRMIVENGRNFRLAVASFAIAGIILGAGLLIKTGALENTWQRTFEALATSKQTYFQASVAFAQIPDFKDTARSLTGNTLIANGVWLLAFGALVLGLRHRRQLVWGVGACAVINLGVFAWKSTSDFEAAKAMLLPPASLAKTNPAEYAQNLPYFAKVIRQNQGDYRTLNFPLSSANMSWRAEGLWGYDPSVLKRYAEYMYFSQGINPDEASQNPPFRQQSPLLNMFRLRYAFMPDGKVVDMGEPLTRFLIVSKYKVLKERDLILSEMTKPGFNPKQEVILESEPNPVPDNENVAYTVRLLGVTSDSWTLEIICDKATLLLMTDAYAKGWKATTQPGSVQTNYDVMPANYAMRAIPLAQGRHVLKLEYKQPGLVTGVKISLATTLLLGIIIGVPAFRRRLDFSVKESIIHANIDDPDIETVKCANCGGDETGLVCKKQVPGGRVYSMVQCKRCGLVYINPRLTQEAILATYRDSAYFQRGEEDVTGYNDYTVDRELHENFFSSQLNSIEKQLPKKGRLLDVGCAFGYLLNEARQRGWQVTGIELSGGAFQYARNELKLLVHDKPLRELTFPPASFEAVVMDDVIEHYGDPAAEIREVARVLTKGGAFMLHTPNYASPWRSLMGEKWVHLKPEEHLYYFSPATLSDMLNKNGFKVVYARARGKATNLAYIIGVARKFLPGFARLLEKTIGRLPMAKWAFSFRGGGMEVLAIKK
ncbi:class I SAM-dependent methyltransferase [Ereboglobus luteus]|nr:class I SAM-dependent methyltransferase [Ereboglobus luteus]